MIDTFRTRSAPRTIFSSASVKSARATFSCPRRAATTAASLTRLAMSAPTMPAVLWAIWWRSTSSSSGTDRLWTRRIISRPTLSGGCTATRRSKRPGRSSAGSSTSGRLVAPRTITPAAGSNPSISVRIWLSVCSRSSWPLRTPPEPPRARPIASSSSMKMIAGLASHRPRKQRLAGAGRAREQHAARDARSQLRVLVRVAKEVDDLDQLLLGLVDPRHVVERDGLLLGLHELGARAAELTEHTAGAAAGRTRRAPQEEDEQRHQQERRAEREEDRLEQRAAVRRLGVDRHVLVLEQLGELLVVGERRDLGLELLGLVVLVADLVPELALDGVAARGDLLDVPLAHLRQEGRVVRDPDALLAGREDRDDQPVQEEQDGEDRQEAAPAPGQHRRLLRRPVHAHVAALRIAGRERCARIRGASLVGHRPIVETAAGPILKSDEAAAAPPLRPGRDQGARARQGAALRPPAATGRAPVAAAARHRARGRPGARLVGQRRREDAGEAGRPRGVPGLG